jgi:hypothetical protein
MSRRLDIAAVEAALKRAANKVINGTLEERSGRFQHVQPSGISSIRYNHKARELDITFTGARTNRYYNVSLENYLDFLEAGSKDAFFNDSIKNKFASADVEARSEAEGAANA